MEVVKVAMTHSQESVKIMAWHRASGSHGRKDPKGIAKAGDWQVGDKIMSAACYRTKDEEFKLENDPLDACYTACGLNLENEAYCDKRCGPYW